MAGILAKQGHSVMHSGIQPISEWGTPAIGCLLLQEFGARPGLLLDQRGIISAINDAAAELLGNTKERLVGTEFGLWASQLEQVDLDVMKQVEGAVRVSVVRATRREISEGQQWVPVALESVKQPGRTLLGHAVFSGVIAASRAVASEAGELFAGSASIGKMPEVTVPEKSIDAFRTVTEFVVRMASIVQPKLAIQFVGWGTGSVEVEIVVDLKGKDPVEVFSPDVEFPNFPTGDLRCTLRFDYPQLCAVLQLPYLD